MNLQLREDAYYVETPTGVHVRTGTGSVTINGAGAYHMIDRLAPYLDGRRSMEHLLGSLSEARRPALRSLLTMLLDRGVVRTVSDTPVGTSTDPDVRFVGYHTDQPVERLQRFRELVIRTIGDGPLEAALRRAFHRTGCRTVSDAAPAPDLIISLTDDPARAAEAERSAADRAIPLVQIVRYGGSVLVGPVAVPDPAVRGAAFPWRRLAGIASAAGSSAEPGAAAAAVIANQIGHAVLRRIAVDQPPAYGQVQAVDLDTLRTERHRFLAHPYDLPVAAPAVPVSIGERDAAPALDPEAFSRDVMAATGPLTGVIGELTEDDLAQLPVHVTAATVADPLGLLPADARPVRVAGTGDDFAAARHDAARRALARYATLMVDPRRLVTADGTPWAAVGEDPQAALERLLRAPADARITGRCMVSGGTRAVPAAAVFRILAGDRRMPLGVAAAYRWSDAVLDGLLQHCRGIALDQPGLALGRPIDLEPGYAVTMLTAAGRRVEAFAMSGVPGVPMAAVTLDGRPVSAEPGTSRADALDRALRAALCAHQSAAEGQPLYAPAPVPDYLAPPAPTTAIADDDRSVDRDAIVAALHRTGRTVTAVPLDHDPEVSRIMPNLVAVVVTR